MEFLSTAKPIADSRDCDDPARAPGALFKLPPEIADMYMNGVNIVGRRSPHRLQQMIVSQYPFNMARQLSQEVKFNSRQVDLYVVAPYLSQCRVDFDLTGFEHRNRLLGRCDLGTPHHCADSGEELS